MPLIYRGDFVTKALAFQSYNCIFGSQMAFLGRRSPPYFRCPSLWLMSLRKWIEVLTMTSDRIKVITKITSQTMILHNTSRNGIAKLSL